MMKKVTKAVIPAAGLGTRVLPATKAMPKGMLPIVDKPAIQYLVEEAVRSGITDILIILAATRASLRITLTAALSWKKSWQSPARKRLWKNAWVLPTWQTSSLCVRSRRWVWAMP